MYQIIEEDEKTRNILRVFIIVKVCFDRLLNRNLGKEAFIANELLLNTALNKIQSNTDLDRNAVSNDELELYSQLEDLTVKLKDIFGGLKRDDSENIRHEFLEKRFKGVVDSLDLFEQNFEQIFSHEPGWNQESIRICSLLKEIDIGIRAIHNLMWKHNERLESIVSPKE